MKIYYINPSGTRFDFGDDIKITQVSGINPSCNVTMSENAFGDGADYISERTSSRNITLTLCPCCDYDEARLRLGKLFYGNGEGTLGFIYDNGEERSIQCRFESITAVLTARCGTMQVSLLCDDPYFIKDGEPILICGDSDLWEFDNWEIYEDELFEFSKISIGASAAVYNEGEIDAGCIIQINVKSSVNGIKITQKPSSEFIALRGDFYAGDIITIDTRPRRISIKLTSVTSDTEKDIMSRLIWGSTFFSIPRGRCRISAETASGVDKLDINLRIDENYRGI